MSSGNLSSFQKMHLAFHLSNLPQSHYLIQVSFSVEIPQDFHLRTRLPTIGGAYYSPTIYSKWFHSMWKTLQLSIYSIPTELPTEEPTSPFDLIAVLPALVIHSEKNNFSLSGDPSILTSTFPPNISPDQPTSVPDSPNVSPLSCSPDISLEERTSVLYSASSEPSSFIPIISPEEPNWFQILNQVSHPVLNPLVIHLTSQQRRPHQLHIMYQVTLPVEITPFSLYQTQLQCSRNPTITLKYTFLPSLTALLIHLQPHSSTCRHWRCFSYNMFLPIPRTYLIPMSTFWNLMRSLYSTCSIYHPISTVLPHPSHLKIHHRGPTSVIT